MFIAVYCAFLIKISDAKKTKLFSENDIHCSYYTGTLIIVLTI